MEKLVIDRVSKSYDGKRVVENICINVGEKEIVSLLGVSGAGKTTIFNIAAGIEQPDKGNVVVNGENVTGKPGHVSYMLQDDLLFPYKNIIDNVSLPLVIKGMKKKEARDRALEFFDLFKLNASQAKYPSEISGGMKQRAALLRTYLCSSPVLLLDEPFSALDAITKADIHKWYLEISDKMGLSTLFITHDIDEAIMLSDRIYVISSAPGKIVGEIVLKKSKKESFSGSIDFAKYKRQILKMLGII